MFCYREHEIDVPEAQVRISAAARALDWLLHLGLGFRTFRAQGIRTDVYLVDSTHIRARTLLTIIATDHWFYVLPTHEEQASEVDVVCTLESPDAVLMNANQVISTSGLKMWGAWHAEFHRIL